MEIKTWDRIVQYNFPWNKTILWYHLQIVEITTVSRHCSFTVDVYRRVLAISHLPVWVMAISSSLTISGYICPWIASFKWTPSSESSSLCLMGMVSTIDPSWSNTLMFLQKRTCYLFIKHRCMINWKEDFQMCV